mmetsp:Transcript_93563/g.260509  ORF Transcript_93563/g.260509 Transcript_93563/m.260509 type:complete len:238 (+) Transcript_93563:49-762(+)
MPSQARAGRVAWLWLAAVLLNHGSSEYFHDEQRDGKLQMTPEDRHKLWDQTYADPRSKSGKDWYGTWAQFKKDVAGEALHPQDEILVVGCGNSNLSADLAAEGMGRVTSIDYSVKAIELQKQRFPSLMWVHADVRHMPRFLDGMFDVVIDKALMDGEGAFKQHPKMLAEVSRVLRPGGRFICISLGKPEELDTKEFFRNDSYGWRVQHKLSYDDYWVYTMTKHEESYGQEEPRGQEL